MHRIAATLAVVALLFSGGATLAHDTSEANELFAEAVKLVNSAENVEGLEEKVVVLEEALSKLNEIVEDYPSSDLAIKLANGQETGGISLEVVSKAAGRAHIMYYEGGSTPENFVEQFMRIFKVLKKLNDPKNS